MTLYDADFFAGMEDTATRSARVIVPMLCQTLAPSSVVDIGGGAGCWAAAFVEAGVTDCICVDGAYVDLATLRIPSGSFVEADISKPLNLGRRFDLVLCLEVAEHLSEEAADTLVQSIVTHADSALFSAAIPHQIGTHHVNTQWPAYWAEKFRARGFRCFDCIRWKVWNNDAVAPWYKQNTLLFLRSDALARIPGRLSLLDSEVIDPPAVVHPDVYLKTVGGALRKPHLAEAVRVLAESAKRSIQARGGRKFQAV